MLKIKIAIVIRSKEEARFGNIAAGRKDRPASRRRVRALRSAASGTCIQARIQASTDTHGEFRGRFT
jgi:hypothetical protein